MAWVVDTSVLLDICLPDPSFAQSSAKCLAARLTDGLTISPVTYIELSPAFAGDAGLQDQFLALVGVQWREVWTLQDTLAAHTLWADQVESKRSGHSAKRPVADILIEAFTQRFQGLITRNPRHFKTVPTVVPK